MVDIFKGTGEKDAAWLAAASSLAFRKRVSA
jgi:hypothetical protein